MKYLKIFLTMAVILTVVLTALPNGKKVTRTNFLLDTYITVTAYGKNAKQAAEEAVSKVHEIELLLSCFYDGSEVYKINNAKKDMPVKVSDEVFYLIKNALHLSRETDGAFDITIKPVMDLWSFGDKNRVPTDEELLNAIQKVNYKNIELDEKEKTVTKKEDGLQIDLGGIAKGYAADCAARVLKEHGIKSAYLDFGGNVLTVGKRPNGIFKKSGDFKIGVQDPLKPRGNSFYTVTSNSDIFTVVTSGGYERNFTKNGKTYHHIIDAKTGKQPQNEILSVTVTGKESYLCDVLSTAFFVGGEKLAEKNKDKYKEAIFYLKNGEIIKITGEN